MYVDTHCHLDDEKIADVESVVDSFTRVNVKYAVNMSCNLKSCNSGRELSKRFENVYFGVGVHPSDIDEFGEVEEKLYPFLLDEKCVAVGEIGLDYHYEGYDRQRQIDGFLRQIEIAEEYKLPVSVHFRDATLDAVNLLKENKDKLVYGGVIHCFSGSLETAKEYLKLGLHLGFGGTSTFKNARNLIEVIKYVPEDFMLTETDSPYLSPEPYRGKINTPENIPVICHKLAEIKGIDSDILAEKILENTRRLFYKLK